MLTSAPSGSRKFSAPDQRLQKSSSGPALLTRVSMARPRGQILPIHISGVAPQNDLAHPRGWKVSDHAIDFRQGQSFGSGLAVVIAMPAALVAVPRHHPVNGIHLLTVYRMGERAV